ncbi:MAG: hypothetical protein Q9160_004158 [Pyrenula sp. 1 TL-2023]
MPLDSSLYQFSLLRTDGRRWNELRRVTASISTQPSTDGSSLLSMGNTTIVCTVQGPREGRGQGNNSAATLETIITIHPFAQTDRKRRGKNDKRVQRVILIGYQELQTTLTSSLSPHLQTHLYPRSTITLTHHVLSLDGSLLAALLNASTLALIDAGIPMPSLLCACTAGLIPKTSTVYTSNSTDGEVFEPVLDLTGSEEQELPFLTAGTVVGMDAVGAEEGQKTDKVATLVMESRCPLGSDGRNLEAMLAVAIDGAKQVRSILEDCVRRRGERAMR